MTGIEASIERKAGTYTTSCGGLLLKLMGCTGIPDRLCILPNGRILFVEFKRSGGKLSPAQAYWLDRLVHMGFDAYEVDNFELFKRLIDERRFLTT